MSTDCLFVGTLPSTRCDLQLCLLKYIEDLLLGSDRFTLFAFVVKKEIEFIENKINLPEAIAISGKTQKISIQPMILNIVKIPNLVGGGGRSGKFGWFPTF